MTTVKITVLIIGASPAYDPAFNRTTAEGKNILDVRG